MILKVFSLILITLFYLGEAKYFLDEYREVKALWKEFKDKFEKFYEQEVDSLRLAIFYKNVEHIRRHNLEYNAGLHTYRLGINQFTDMSTDEFRAINGFRLPENYTRRDNGPTFLGASPFTNLPQSVNWTAKGAVTPVKNQGHCGSCWSFSATGALEGQYYRKKKILQSFSEQQLVDCSESFGNNGCNGGLMDNAFKYIQQYGLEEESDYPYDGKDEQCHYEKQEVVTKDEGFVDIESKNEQKLMEAVATIGPIAVAIDASHMSFQFYRDGVYSDSKCSEEELDHGVLVVGYGNLKTWKGRKDYWLIKNSWGPEWGQHGYIMIERNNKNMCGVATQASYPIL
ncbi:hypothetical protein SNEBB_009936 [Seison nebaliae]|nr:hypothetical protein SNEBB_009936 [Seison nebaliae]